MDLVKSSITKWYFLDKKVGLEEPWKEYKLHIYMWDICMQENSFIIDVFILNHIMHHTSSGKPH